jgi:transposase
MSLTIHNNDLIPAETVRIAKLSFPKGTALITLRDEIGPLFQDEDFSDLYSWKGAEGLSPAQLAVVLLLQFAEGLTDRQAAEAVRSRIDWKYLLGLELSYPGFDFSVLSEFRKRLVDSGTADRLFERPLAKMRELGIIRERGRQRSDSTHVLAAIRTLNRMELTGETQRNALEQLAIVAPRWLQSWVPSEWFERYGGRMEQAKFPTSKTKQEALAKQIGQDGFLLLDALNQPDTPSYLLELPIIKLLREVWEQQYIQVPSASGRKPSEVTVTWRPTKDLPPASEMINSPYDPEARYSRKRQTTWTGYKVHLSESCDDDLPHLITHVETTPATEPDCQTLPKIHRALADKGLLPHEHLVDAGYIDADNILESENLGIDLNGPVRPDSSWQALKQTGYDIAHFIVDWDAKKVTCPQGKVSRVWSPTTDKKGVKTISVRFHRGDCSNCPVRELCTHAKIEARGLRLQPQEKHQTLQQGRLKQQDPSFWERYKPRAGIEGTIAQATGAFNLRRTRFIGEEKTRLQHWATASAINLARLANWFTGVPRATTRVSAFAELATASFC